MLVIWYRWSINNHAIIVFASGQLQCVSHCEELYVSAFFWLNCKIFAVCDFSCLPFFFPLKSPVGFGGWSMGLPTSSMFLPLGFFCELFVWSFYRSHYRLYWIHFFYANCIVLFLRTATVWNYLSFDIDCLNMSNIQAT